MLNWRSLMNGPHDPRLLIRGAELAVATVPGTHSRFAIYEVRTLVAAPAGSQNRYEFDRAYAVRDAGAINDADVKTGKRPPVVYRNDDCDTAVAWCREQPA